MSRFTRDGNKETRKKKKNFIFRRDGYRCVYCGKKLRDDTAQVDHIIPAVKGGTNALDNLVTCCRKCNQLKADNHLDDRKFRIRYGPMKYIIHIKNTVGYYYAPRNITNLIAEHKEF